MHIGEGYRDFPDALRPVGIPWSLDQDIYFPFVSDVSVTHLKFPHEIVCDRPCVTGCMYWRLVDHGTTQA